MKLKLSKMITSFVILCAGPLFAQSITTPQTLPYVTTPYHVENGWVAVTPNNLLTFSLEETIPTNSVDPVYLDKTPSCPRSEYHIRW